MRIMGIDPGYAIVGVGLVDYDNVRFSLVEYRHNDNHARGRREYFYFSAKYISVSAEIPRSAIHIHDHT